MFKSYNQKRKISLFTPKNVIATHFNLHIIPMKAFGLPRMCKILFELYVYRLHKIHTNIFYEGKQLLSYRKWQFPPPSLVTMLSLQAPPIPPHPRPHILTSLWMLLSEAARMEIQCLPQRLLYQRTLPLWHGSSWDRISGSCYQTDMDLLCRIKHQKRKGQT